MLTQFTIQFYLQIADTMYNIWVKVQVLNWERAIGLFQERHIILNLKYYKVGQNIISILPYLT